ncbi:hypothetical protein P879_04043 [Paragonimus westermani]|uniref:F-box domain-containing protein n=1 Tax=Paragonimus westermani TaxID=34504 RepID=A0A8T0DRK3_9TREM|nr:hypothetical protein P879_04043 [Paragonimus westermani]
MDNKESLIYSYPLFPLHVTDVVPEHPYVAHHMPQCPLASLKSYSQSEECMHSGSFNMSKWKTMAQELHPQPVCPGCVKQSPENTNWCSTCGELLIGASLCSSDLSDWNPHGASFQSLQMAHAEPVTCAPEWTVGIFQRPTGCINSYFAQDDANADDHVNYPHQATSTIALEPSFSTTSFVATPSFVSSLSKIQSNVSDGSQSAVTQQSTQTYVAETSAPRGGTQIETLKSTFNELNLRSVHPASVTTFDYVGCRTQEYSTSCGSSFVERSTKTAYSYPETLGDYTNSFPYFGRQRCISGPVRNAVANAELGYQSDLPCVEFVPTMYRLEDCNSPPGLLIGQVFPPYMGSAWCTQVNQQQHQPSQPHQQTSQYRESDFIPQMPLYTQGIISHSCASVCVPGSSFVQKAHQQHIAVYPRRKNPSECTRNQLNETTIETRNTLSVPTNARARSVSPDIHLSSKRYLGDTKAIKPNKLQFNWQSSRTAWSAHDPVLAKKKSAAYLRASYSHGARKPTEQHSKSQSLFRNTELVPDTVRHVTHSAQPSSRNEQAKAKCFSNTPTSTINACLYHKQERRRKRNRMHKPKQQTLITCETPSTQRCVSSAPLLTDTRVDRVSSTSSSRADSVTVQKELEPVPEPPTLCSSGQPDWLLLPDELWLAVIRPLSPADRARLALVCRRLAALTLDRSLWRVVQLHRHHHLTDMALTSIGRLCPRELRLTYCRGDNIAVNGLRQLFKSCGPHLRKLSFIGCSKGVFDCDLTLLLAAEHCPNMSHINASYTQAVRDRTVTTLAKSALHLVSVKLNGAQLISNSAIQQLVHYHKDTLQRLELFGCFRLNSDIFAVLGRCQQLRALAFGHLHHLSSDGLLELVGKLPLLSSLDLRGTQALTNDTNLTRLADKCPHLEEVVLANIHSLKHEAGIAHMLRRLPRLRVLDLCGLTAVGDLTMEALANGCPQLEELDITCTSVTQKGLTHLTQTPAKCLRCLQISHCHGITKDVLEKLVKTCSKLTLLYVYGFKNIKDWSFLQTLRPELLVKSDG